MRRSGSLATWSTSLRQLRRPPTTTGRRENGQALLQRLAPPLPVHVRADGARRAAIAIEVGLEFGPELSAPAMPVLEVGQHDDGAQQRVDRASGNVGPLGQEIPEIELPGLVRLGRRPEARISQQAVDEEVGHGVAQRIPDALREVVRLKVGEITDRDAAQLLAALPDREEAPLGLGGDLFGGPRLEVELGVRRHRNHALALPDLPVVAREVLEQGVGVVELDRGAGGRTRRPGRRLHLLDRGLETAEGGPHLRLAHQGLRPGRLVAGGAGARDQRRQPVGGLLQLLLAQQAVDLFPGGARAHPLGLLRGRRQPQPLRRRIGLQALAGRGKECESAGENQGRGDRGAHIRDLRPRSRPLGNRAPTRRRIHFRNGDLARHEPHTANSHFDSCRPRRLRFRLHPRRSGRRRPRLHAGDPSRGRGREGSEHDDAHLDRHRRRQDGVHLLGQSDHGGGNVHPDPAGCRRHAAGESEGEDLRQSRLRPADGRRCRR